MFDMTYFFYALGGAVVGFLLSGWIFFYKLLRLRDHISETRNIIEKHEEETDVLRRKLREFETQDPEEPRSMWS